MKKIQVTNWKKIQVYWKKFRSTEKKFRCAGPEIFLWFEADLSFSRPWVSEIKVQIKWPSIQSNTTYFKILLPMYPIVIQFESSLIFFLPYQRTFYTIKVFTLKHLYLSWFRADVCTFVNETSVLLTWRGRALTGNF